MALGVVATFLVAIIVAYGDELWDYVSVGVSLEDFKATSSAGGRARRLTSDHEPAATAL